MEDFGSYIKGSAKDNRSSRHNTKQKSTIKKASIWPKPDYQKIVDSGVPKIVAFWQKEMRDAVPAYKSGIGKDRYKELTEEIKTAVENVKTEEEMKDFFNKFYTENGWIRVEGKRYITTLKSSIYLSAKLFRTSQIFINNLRAKMETTGFLSEKKTLTNEKFFVPEVQDVSPEDFLALDIRGAQFGSSMSQKERKNYLNQTYQAFCDMADALDIPRKYIGLSNAVSFGARGSSGAEAHYEIDNAIINLTRKAGSGSLAHEYGHALDNRINKYFGHKDMASNLKYDIPEKLPKFTALIYSLKTIDGKTTNFYKDARTCEDEYRCKVGYWNSEKEMFARAFACYVKDKCEEKGIKNDFLYGNCDTSEYTYPKGNERVAYKHMFDEMIDELKYWCLFCA